MKGRRAVFTSPSGEAVTADYDLLVGADGVNSRVRCSKVPFLKPVCCRWDLSSLYMTYPVDVRLTLSGHDVVCSVFRLSCRTLALGAMLQVVLILRAIV